MPTKQSAKQAAPASKGVDFKAAAEKVRAKAAFAPPPPPVVEETAQVEDAEQVFSFNIDDAVGMIADKTPVVATIRRWEMKYAQSTGNPMFSCQYVIDESPNDKSNGKFLFANLVQTEAAMGFTKNFLSALGLDWRDGKYRRSDIEGLQIGIIVKYKDDPAFGPKNEVARYISVEKARAAIAAHIGATADAEPIPFS